MSITLNLPKTQYLEYSDASHRYFADGVELPSVTQILDAAGLVSPFCRDAEAAWRGSEVHRLCAIDDGEGLDMRTVPASLRGYIRAWRAYRQVSGFSPILIEQRVDDFLYNYSGRLDRVGYRNGTNFTTVLDIKTSQSGAVADYVRYQLVAYASALGRETYERMAVSLKPDGTFNVKTFPVMEYHQDLAQWRRIVKQVREKKHENDHC